MHCALIAVLAAQAVLAQRFPNATMPRAAANSTRHALQPAVMGEFRLQGCEVSQTESPGFQEVASTDEMSVDYCAKRCKSEYFGVSDRKCYCGHSLAKSARAVDSGMCDVPCPGNAGQICGGKMRVGRKMNERRQEQAQEGEPEPEPEQSEPEQSEPEQSEPEQPEPEQQEPQQPEPQQQGAGQDTAAQPEAEQEGQHEATAEAEVLPRAEAEVEVQAQAEAQEAIFSLYRRFRSSARASNATAHPLASLHALNATAHNNASANASLAGAEGEACTQGYTNNTRGERVCHDGKGKGQRMSKGDDGHGRPYNMAVVNGAAVAGAGSLLSSIALAVALL